MKTGRLEAFSDGVIAIIITIMVLELKVPHGSSFYVLKPLIPDFITYLVSFIYLGIYWNNHHHLLHATQRVNGKVLWANLHLLFWLSLFPFATGWMGENHFASNPVLLYGIVLLMAALAYKLLAFFVIKSEGADSLIRKAYASDRKGNGSILIYLLALIFSLFLPLVSIVLYILIAIIWFVPDSRIERHLK